VERSYCHGNEHSGSIKYWEIIEKLGNWQILKRDSVDSLVFKCIGLKRNLKWRFNCFREKNWN
jgi:hypothetical protein